MMFFNASGLIQTLLLCTLATAAKARNFTDDRGVFFTWPDNGASPTVVVNANGGIALFHLGMTNEQILGVWDKWIVRGSDIDLNSEDLDSYFEADPNRPEVNFLKSVKDLSPECSGDPNGCSRQLDVSMLNELAPDFVVYMHHGPFPEITQQIAQTTGKDALFIDDRFENKEGCRTENFETTDTNCYARSVFDVIQRTRELAAFLGVSESDQIMKDQQAMCEAANEFTLMAEQLHNRGVRCVGATARMNGGGNVNLVNLNQNPWLRTFEELGLPIMHPPLKNPTDFTRTYTAEEWFPGCNRMGGDAFNCDGIAPVLPADCWLFDSRSYPQIAENKEDILTVLSVEAIRQDQFSSLLLNDGSITYRTAAAVLREVTEDLKDSQRIYDETTCTRVEVTTRHHISLAFGGLEGGEYACFDRDTLNSDMLTCPLEGYTPSTSGASYSNGAGAVESSFNDDALESSAIPTQIVAVAIASFFASCLGLVL